MANVRSFSARHDSYDDNHSIPVPIFAFAFTMVTINLNYITPGRSQSSWEVFKRIDYFGCFTLLLAVSCSRVSAQGDRSNMTLRPRSLPISSSLVSDSTKTYLGPILELRQVSSLPLHSSSHSFSSNSSSRRSLCSHLLSFGNPSRSWSVCRT